MKSILFQVTSLKMSAPEILDMIDPQIIQEIKVREPSPMIRAYVIASEGNAYPQIIEGQNVKAGVVQWTKGALKSLISFMQSAIKSAKNTVSLFPGHSPTWKPRSGQQRAGVAHVVGVKELSVGGKMLTAIAAWWPSETKQISDEFPSVSMEVSYEGVSYSDGDEKVTVVEKVLEVLGIALLGKDEEPADSKAYEIGLAFASKVEEQEIKKLDLTTLTFSEIVAEIKRRNTKPTDIFGESELLGTRKVLSDGTIQYYGGDAKVQELFHKLESESKERIELSYKQKVESLTVEASKAKSLESEIAKYRAQPAIQTKLAELKDERLTQYVSRRLGSFVPVPGDDLEKSITEFLTQQKKEMEADAAIFGAVQNGHANAQQNPNMGGGDSTNQGTKNMFGVDDAE